MKADFFAVDQEARAKLRAACDSWLGTPFRERSKVKGPLGGVDCVGFVACVFREIGAISEDLKVPAYDINHAEHSTKSVLLDWLAQDSARTIRARVRRLDEAEPPLDGDLVFPKVGLTEHHLGIAVGQLVYHVIRPTGVCHQTFGQLRLSPFRHRLLTP